MKSFGYYAFDDTKDLVGALNRCSRACDDLPLMINCAGHFSSQFPFMTDNKVGRLDYYVIYVSSGTLTFYSKDTQINAVAGSFALLPASKGYKYSYSGGEELAYYWAHFTGSQAEQYLSDYSLEFFPRVYRSSESRRIIQRFQSIFDAFEKQDRFRDRDLCALLDRLLITLARSVTSEATSASLASSVRYINSNYTSSIRIPELAAMEHLSVSRYIFLFKERFGIPPKQYILKLRMSLARELLFSTDLSIKQIGIMCGYEDSHFFSKCFKSFFGAGPTQYRTEQ
jgi:AraC-like DNA-binding protein